MNPPSAQVAILTRKVKDLELAAAQQRLYGLSFDGNRRYFAEWKIRTIAALEEMADKTEKQKIKFIMDRTHGRAFQRLRRRLPWSNQPGNAAFRTHDEVFNHLERQFGDLDCRAYPEPSDLKQKDDEPFDHFLVRWEHWALSFDMSERQMVADLNSRLNSQCRSSHLPHTLRELASGCRKREWESKPPSLMSLIGLGIGFALLMDSMCSDPTPN